jgi:hypothetical protein
MSLLENILDIFFIEEKTEESVELNIKDKPIEKTEEVIEKIEVKPIEKTEEVIEKIEVKPIEKTEEVIEKIEVKPIEETKEVIEKIEVKPIEETKVKPIEEPIEETKNEAIEETKIKVNKSEKKYVDKETSVLKENLEKSEKISKDLKEELQEEIKKIQNNLEEKLILKPLNLHVYNDHLELFKNLKITTLLIINDKEQKRKLKKVLLENDINNIYIISSLKDLKRKTTTIPEIKNIVIEGEVFENNTENVIKILNVESKIQYSVYYPISEYKTVIKTFSKKPVKLVTNKSTFKKSKFQAIAKKLKISDDDIML